MKIDWITFAAQIINFLVLLFLLKRFLYQPVLSAMDRRKKRTEEELNSARAKNQEAEKALQKIKEQASEMERIRAEGMQEVRRDMEQYRSDLSAQYHSEISKSRQNWQDSLEDEKDAFIQNISENILKHNKEVLKKMIQDLAGENLENLIISYFIENRLPEILEDIKSGDTVYFHSAFEIQPASIGEIESCFTDHGLENIKMNFEISDNIIAGMEIVCRGKKVSWNIADYLEKFSQNLKKEFNR